MLVDFARLSVLAKQPPENTLPPHPLHLRRHARLRRTLPFTRTGVTPLALRREELLGASPRVNGRGLDDDATILDELLNVSAGVGVPNLSLLGGVKPDFALADACDGCGEPLLRAKVDHAA